MSLSREEFRDGILMAGIPMTENEIESLLNVLDKDGDGEINYRFDQSAFNLWSRDFGYAKKIGNFWWSFMFRHEWWFIYNSYPMITIFSFLSWFMIYFWSWDFIFNVIGGRFVQITQPLRQL